MDGDESNSETYEVERIIACRKKVSFFFTSDDEMYMYMYMVVQLCFLMAELAFFPVLHA